MSGQCYKLAYTEQLNTPGAKLVHGIVTPIVGKLKGQSYGHAWIENNNDIIDPSLPIGRQRYSKEEYYLLGGIGYVRKYTLSETLSLVNKELHFGPWDRKISEAEHLIG